MAEPAPLPSEGLRPSPRDRFQAAVREAATYTSEDLGAEGTSGYLLSEDRFDVIFAAGDELAEAMASGLYAPPPSQGGAS